MKTIKKDELFHHLDDFFKSKGIELKEGSVTTSLQRGCDLLADAINATQKTVKQTKAQVDEALDQLRQSIHESTAPPPAPAKTKRQAKPRGKRKAANAGQARTPRQ